MHACTPHMFQCLSFKHAQAASHHVPPVTMHQLWPNSALARQLQCLSSNISIIINILNTPGFSEFKKTPWWLR
jgi:hypothetical protein